MTQRVEESSNVCVEHIVHFSGLDSHRQRVQRHVGAAAGAEAVREAQEVGLVDGVEHSHRRPLDDLIFQDRHADGTWFAICFGDVSPLDRLGPICSSYQTLGQVAKIALQFLSIRLPGLAVHACRGIVR